MIGSPDLFHPQDVWDGRVRKHRLKQLRWSLFKENCQLARAPSGSDVDKRQDIHTDHVGRFRPDSRFRSDQRRPEVHRQSSPIHGPISAQFWQGGIFRIVLASRSGWVIF